MSTELIVQKRPPRPLWWGFAPFVLASAVHCTALFAGAEAIAGPTKLALMPTLILAAMWGLRRLGNTAVFRLLLAGLFFSWLGDGAGTFFPFAPTLPMMLAFFALAHLCYIRVFWHHLALRPFPRWALIFILWWAVLLTILWPRAGSLALAVAAYGLVLGTTAALSTRCSSMIMWGSAFFLASDTILAFRIFALELMPDWTSGMVMLTYTVGQGLIIAGALQTQRSSK
ncbi:hypothetical protein AS189_14480 [Arthrobacter alpinus]|uniref:YhhN-like protein n=1 Tax=Arthrobacter alpinus TaxID=656366 RepID=A0A0S2M120_9MICC|nr:lysoplasmalogenase [Arthrobacter alpinus]ALO67477.1 hypothetical protein AS189_14480 [Arthrobacter alpinus]